jgi:protein-L-isoaspartate(D-aspartate) O-methyltransferase
MLSPRPQRCGRVQRVRFIMEGIAGRTRSSAGPRELAGLVRAAGVSDARVLEAVGWVPRAAFVPAEQVDRAYRDEPITIPHGQVTTQPSLVARMLEALVIEGGERVLEVGTGYGFQTALLARLAGQGISVERFADLAAAARDNLESRSVAGVEVQVGDEALTTPHNAPDHAPDAANRPTGPHGRDHAGGRSVRSALGAFAPAPGRRTPQVGSIPTGLDRIRTTNLTIMSRARPCNGGSAWADVRKETPATRWTQVEVGWPGAAACLRARGPVVDPGTLRHDEAAPKATRTNPIVCRRGWARRWHPSVLTRCLPREMPDRATGGR